MMSVKQKIRHGEGKHTSGYKLKLVNQWLLTSYLSKPRTQNQQEIEEEQNSTPIKQTTTIQTQEIIALDEDRYWKTYLPLLTPRHNLKGIGSLPMSSPPCMTHTHSYHYI